MQTQVKCLTEGMGLIIGPAASGDFHWLTSIQDFVHISSKNTWILCIYLTAWFSATFARTTHWTLLWAAESNLPLHVVFI